MRNTGFAGEKFNYEGLRRAIEHLSDFEKKANLRVIDSGVLKGLNFEDIKRAGERLILQDGCTNFFLTAVKNENLNTNIHVLSYCWCGDLIRSAFSSGTFFLFWIMGVLWPFYLSVGFKYSGLDNCKLTWFLHYGNKHIAFSTTKLKQFMLVPKSFP